MSGGQGQPGEGPVRDGRRLRRDVQSRGADQHRRQRGHRQGPGVELVGAELIISTIAMLLHNDSGAMFSCVTILLYTFCEIKK